MTLLRQNDFSQGLRRVFRSLDEQALRDLLTAMTRLDLKKNDILFYEGEPADSLYIVVQGKLGAVHQKEPGEMVLVNIIGQGETVGENGLLSGSPRGLTVKALSDCELLKLTHSAFEQFYQTYPSSLLDLSQLIITRQNQSLTKFVAEKPRPYCIALVRTETTPTISRFLQQLERELTSTPSIKLVSAEAIETQQIENPLDAPQLIEFIENIRSDISCFVYSTALADRRLSHFYEHFFDAVVWLADARSSPQTCGEQWADLSPSTFSYEPRKELLLLHQDNGPRHTQPWLDWETFALVHHLQIDNPLDYGRLLHFFSGKAVGLVLSGSGARVWVHLGALRAIFESGLPIDAIGGTSGGAVAAACYAATLDYEAFYQKMLNIIMSELKPMALRNFTLPLVSILSAKRGTNRVRSEFGDLRIEDLATPFFCVACNLNQSSEIVWQRGEVWKTVRSSMSVPGLIPPVVEKGELYVDGGVVNNLPVDVMRQLLAPRGFVIAVDAMHSGIDTQHYHFPPVFSFADSLLTICKLKNRSYRFPNFGETMLKSLCMGAQQRVEMNRENADLLIQPDLGDISMVDVQRGRSLMATSYQETKLQLEKLPLTMQQGIFAAQKT